MARYGDATLLVHLAYVRHLIPHSIRSGAVCYILSLYETCVQVYNRIVKVPGTLARRSVSFHIQFTGSGPFSKYNLRPTNKNMCESRHRPSSLTLAYQPRNALMFLQQTEM